MPHVIIEYTEDAIPAPGVGSLLDAAHGAVIASGLFETDHVKSRAVPLAHYRVGDNDRPFVYVQLRIKPGRSDGQKNTLSQAVLRAISALDTQARVLTVEVVELDAASYAKLAR